MKKWLVRIFVYAFACVIIAASGYSAGWLITSLFGSMETNSAVTLEPQEVVLISPVEEYSEVLVPLSITNQSKYSVSIAGVTSSCGCTKVLIGKDGSAAVPFELKAGESIPLQGTIDTSEIRGDRQIRFAVDARIGDKSLTNISSIVVHVLPGLRCISPPEMIQDNDGDTAEIDVSFYIGDAFVDPGIEIDSISSSDPEKLRADIQSILGVSAFETSEDAPEWQKRFRNRYEVQVHILRDTGPFEGRLTVHPKDTKYKPLTIPIKYSGSQRKGQVFPPEIIIPRSDIQEEEFLRREIRIVSPKTDPPELLHPIAAPPGVEVNSISKTNNEWLVDVSICPSVSKEERIQPLVLGNAKGQKFVEIPISFLGKID
jgi:Protein of unknown function (DUF1573).